MAGTACDNLTGGITLGCDNNVGGLKRIFLLEKSYVTSVSLSSPGDTISAINTTGSPPANFYEFVFNKNTSSYTENQTSDQASGRDLYEQTINLVLNRREKTKRDVILLLGQRKNLVAVVEDNNGVYWYFGESFGLNLTTNNGGSGVQKSDPNQYVIILVGTEPTPANTLTSSAFSYAIS